MAKVHIQSGQGAVGTGDLQLQNGAAMDATLRPVTDAANTASPLELSTGLVAVTSTLQIATNDTEYIDAEDGSGNNRFTVSRASGSQVVNVDFASNPTAGTDQVGAIRTYADGASLSDAVSFLRNGRIGIGTSSPSYKVEINSTDNTDTTVVTTSNDKSAILSTYNSHASSGNFLQLRSYGAGTSGTIFGNSIAKSNMLWSNVDNLFAIGTIGATPLIFGTSNAERMRITDTGNVGIGTSSPASPLSVGGTATHNLPASTANFSTSDAGKFQLRLTSTSFNADGNWVGLGMGYSQDYMKLAIIARASDGNGRGTLNFCNNGAAGSSNVDLTHTIASITSNGLTFNGDTAAANALDDYEEGTWTMGLSFGGGTTGITYSNRTGSYTKIGRQVTVTGFANLTSKGSSTGDAAITGLPFTIGNALSFYSAATIRYNNVTFANQTQSFGQTALTTIALEEITEAGVVTTLTDANFANNSEILISFTYFV